MNLFIMYMSGSSISIFPIMMVVMMMFRYAPDMIMSCRNLILDLQTSEDPVLSEASFQGF